MGELGEEVFHGVGAPPVGGRVELGAKNELSVESSVCHQRLRVSQIFVGQQQNAADAAQSNLAVGGSKGFVAAANCGAKAASFSRDGFGSCHDGLLKVVRSSDNLFSA